MSTETGDNPLQTLLAACIEPGADRDRALARFDAWRQRSSEDSAALDALILDHLARLRSRIGALTDTLEEVGAAQAELKALMEKLTAPPWHPAMFKRFVETAAGNLAEVVHSGGISLVPLAGEVRPEDLCTGRRVYLAQERNAVLDVAPVELPEAGELVTVEQVLDGGRLLARDRDTPVVIHASRALRDVGVSPGDQVRWDRAQMLAYEIVESSSSSDLMVTEQIAAGDEQQLGGLDDEVAEVTALFVLCIVHPGEAARYGLNRGATLFMHGPPGTGKTSIARAVGAALAEATGRQCRFASVKGAQLESPWVGSTQRNIRDLFQELAKDDAPALLFIDEVDAIGRVRGGTGGHHSDKFLGAWLTEIDGLVRRGGVIGIIGATNRKDLVDQALLDRLSNLDLHIGRPSLDAAREIFSIHMGPDLPYGPNGAEATRTRGDIIETALGTLYSPNADNAVAELRFRDGSTRTIVARDLLSGRTIEQICLGARRSAFSRHAQGGTPGVRVEDMEEAVTSALQRLTSTLSPANAHAMLPDLPQDLDVVAVDPVRRRVAAHRYLIAG